MGPWGIQVQALEEHSSSEMREARQGHLPIDQLAPGPVQPHPGHLQGCYSKSPACKGPRFRQGLCFLSFHSSLLGHLIHADDHSQKPGESTSKHFAQNNEMNKLAKGFQPLIPTKSLDDKGFCFPERVHCLLMARALQPPRRVLGTTPAPMAPMAPSWLCHLPHSAPKMDRAHEWNLTTGRI